MYTKEEKNVSQSNLGGKVGAKFAVGPGGFKVPEFALAANASAENISANKDIEAYKIRSTLNSITSHPGGRWLISDLISENLSGKYQPEEHLCKIQISEDKTSGSATGELYFYPRDLSIEAIQTESRSLRVFSKEKPEKVAVAKALIAKYLKELNPNHQSVLDGRIVIGSSKINFKLEEVPNGSITSRSSIRRRR